MHTQKVDENGTDLPAVQQMLFGKEGGSIIWDENRYPSNIMNLLYNQILLL